MILDETLQHGGSAIIGPDGVIIARQATAMPCCKPSWRLAAFVKS